MKVRAIAIADDVADILRRSTWDDTTLMLPPTQLERKVYEQVDKVLRALGGKWNRHRGGHIFNRAAFLDLRDALDAGRVVDRKKTLELFETPIPIAERMGEIAAVRRIIDGHSGAAPIRWLEPSAGTGRLVSEIGRYAMRDEDVLAIDIDAANCEALRAQGIATEIVCGDFLSMMPHPGLQVDVILMNPPFSNTADIAHVTHAYRRWLAPGGILVAIMSAHWTFAQDRASRDFAHLCRDIDGRYELLPAGRFKAEGTSVNTVMVTMRKPAECGA